MGQPTQDRRCPIVGDEQRHKALYCNRKQAGQDYRTINRISYHMTPDQINELVDDCIDHLCDDNAAYGAGSLVELAKIWAKAGLTQQSFLDMRQYIINSSIERLGTSATAFIHYKLQLAEQDLTKERNKSAHSNIIIH